MYKDGQQISVVISINNLYNKHIMPRLGDDSMEILKITDLEKHNKDTVLFPAFQLTISANEIVSVHSSMNVRSALLKILMGELPASSGSIYINEKDINESKRSYLKNISVLFLDDGLYERLTVKDHLSFYQAIFSSNFPIEEVARLVQLEDKSKVRVGKLTFSEQRRLHLSRIFFQNAELIIFEEPDQNVDLETKRVFIKAARELKARGKAILVLTGNMESALAVTDTVYRLDDKGLHPIEIQSEENEEEMQEGEPEEIIIQPARFEKIPTKVNDKIVLFDPPEIDYIESSDGQSHLNIKGESYPCMFTMTELESRLIPYGFFRCHRSYIVNLQKVREVITWTRNSFTLVLNDESKSSIPLSKSKMAELKEMLGLK
ncbi:ABC-2 type transport system ATP-binding protein [Cytobacillus horneckiae]